MATDLVDWPVWPALTGKWVNGRLILEGYPRHSWESAERYQKRVAYEYTMQHGTQARDMWLAKKYQEGMEIELLADNFGISVGTAKFLLRKNSLKLGNPPKLPDSVRDAEIYRRRCAGEKFISIGASFGITGHRVSQIFHKMDHKIQIAIHRVRRKPPPSRIIAPSSDILDTWLVSETWTPEMQAMEFERHRGIDIT